MKKLVLTGYYSIILGFLIGCSSKNYIVSENGDKAILEFKNDVEVKSEIICFSDTSLVFSLMIGDFFDSSSQPKNLFYVNYEDLKSISIEGFDGNGWQTSVILLQVVPAGLLTIAAASEEVEALPVLLISCIPAAITSLLLSTSGGEMPQWNDTDSLFEFSDLKIYSRYPNGLSDWEMTKLLEQSDQKELKKFCFE